MMTYKTDWKKFDKFFIEKFLAKNPGINLTDVLFNPEKSSFYLQKSGHLQTLGCVPCLSGETWQNDEGDVVIGNLVLINCKNFADQNNYKIGNDIAEELSVNVWICPNCKRWIFDYLPKYDTMSIVGS